MKDINSLDSKVENIIKKTVKHYYTDWKNYDRPKYMVAKAHKEKSALLIARTCGTYFIPESQNGTDWSRTLIDYYTNQEPANIYKIDFKALTATLIHKGITAQKGTPDMLYLTHLIEYKNGLYLVNGNVFGTLTEAKQYIKNIFEAEAYSLKG